MPKRWFKVRYVIIIIIMLIDLLHSITQNYLESCYVIRNNTFYFDEQELVGLTHRNVKTIKTALYIGYALGQPVGGLCADLYGTRYMALFANLWSSISMIVYPFVVSYMPWYIMASLYLAIGISQGLLHPARFSLLARWVPEHQITFLGGTAQASGFLDHTLIIYMKRYFMNADAKRYLLYVFQFWGGIGCFVCLITFIFLYASPFESKMASQQEKDDMEFVGAKRPKRIRWKDIFTDEAVWAAIIIQVGHGWLRYTMNEEVKKLQVMAEKEEQYLWQISALLWSITVAVVTSSFIVNKLVNQKRIPTIHLRITCIIIGDLFASFPIMLVHHIKAGRNTMALIRFIALLLQGVHYAAGRINILDLTRYYTGTIVGFQYALCDLAGYITHVLTGLTGKSTSSEAVVSWSGLDDLTFGVNMITVLLYVIWARAERTNWDVLVEEEEEFVDELSARN